MKKQTGESVALDQRAKKRPNNYLTERYNCSRKEIITLFSMRGFTLRETAEALDMKYSTLKTQAWELGIKFAPMQAVGFCPAHIVYEGKEYMIKDLAAEHDMSWKTLSDRLRYGWTTEQAVTTPVRQGNWTHREGKDRQPTGTDITSIWLRKAWKL